MEEEFLDDKSDKHRQYRRKYKGEKEALLDHRHKIKTKDGHVWTMVMDHVPESVAKEPLFVGVQGYKFCCLCDGKKASDPHALMDLFALLWPGDWKQQLLVINKQI